MDVDYLSPVSYTSHRDAFNRQFDMNWKMNDTIVPGVEYL
jgi:hypothetical protein